VNKVKEARDVNKVREVKELREVTDLFPPCHPSTLLRESSMKSSLVSSYWRGKEPN
jgi:hypothetical protein